jgi:thiosulfate/3-mercaptopyruvate sulfurtransferase
MLKPSTLALVICSVVLLFAARAPAADSRDAMLVSPDWLAAHLGEADVVLLHVGDRAEYDARHIPGTRYVSTRDISQPAQGPDSLTLAVSSRLCVRSWRA